ncbi:hypothetical protein GF339_09555 [candidate division KSB3 bacterium]|uniref:Uncharacterized protein n=1 Tax=candidate division KSB3 bacterium TaxID=2044937 RepID=A0A9D5JV27_9BACT|nr:hypothetical protein [candidate division KSB3 bacterium]MBD3324818.1 hypothetical protein [candidate division KSB3 bacterium]
MSRRQDSFGHHPQHKKSGYSIRRAYLQALKQFMAEEEYAPHTSSQRPIEDYFRYERRISSDIQTLFPPSSRS